MDRALSPFVSCTLGINPISKSILISTKNSEAEFQRDFGPKTWAMDLIWSPQFFGEEKDSLASQASR